MCTRTTSWITERKSPVQRNNRTWSKKKENSLTMKDFPNKLTDVSATNCTNMAKKRTSIDISTLSTKEKCIFFVYF